MVEAEDDEDGDRDGELAGEAASGIWTSNWCAAAHDQRPRVQIQLLVVELDQIMVTPPRRHSAGYAGSEMRVEPQSPGWPVSEPMLKPKICSALMPWA
ncbi:hypothetical protein [Rhodopseudomonas palustris]|uniref:hypothetical protein n=1 Tax=Rhodopseudomonas palustris TaxID=1076 RepID=UPI001403DD0D|nr:hypothetical protein [Rhodopseudomonas palustris]